MKTLIEIKNEFLKAENTYEFIETKEIKKGDLILQRNSWYGELMEKPKANTVLTNVHGFFEEAGSIYVWDIYKVYHEKKIYFIKLTKKQKKFKIVQSLIF